MNDQTLAEPAAINTSPSTALTVIRADLPTILASDTDDLLGKLAAEIAAFKADPTTPAGRKAIASMAYRVASTKTGLVRLGKSLTEKWRRQTAAVNAECNLIESRMDALKEEVRAPLTEFENRERRRVHAHETALADLAEFRHMVPRPTIADIANRIAQFEASSLLQRDWEEYRDRASEIRANVSDTLTGALAAAKRAYAEAVEAERMRAEEAERQRQAEEVARAEREAEIARAAAEAARKAAEEKAAQEAAEAAAAALAERQRLEAEAQREREAAAIREQRARDAAEAAENERKAIAARAEAWRVAQHKQAIEDLRRIGRPLPDGAASAMAKQVLRGLQNTFNGRDWQEFANEAEKVRAAAQTALEGEQLLAEQREAAEAKRQQEERQRLAAEAAERARQEERGRAEQMAAQVKAVEEARAADQKNRAAIHRTIEAAIYRAIDGKGGLDEQLVAVLAHDVTVALAAGRIPNVSIGY